MIHDGTGVGALLKAIKQVQKTEPLLSDAGIFLGKAPRSDSEPYFLNCIYRPGKGNKKLNGKDSDRRFIIEMKAVAVATEDGQSGFVNAVELANANYNLWTEIIDDLTPRQRLNAMLEPLGWSAEMPLEKGDVGPYYDEIKNLRRDHFGHLFLFVIAKI